MTRHPIHTPAGTDYPTPSAPPLDLVLFDRREAEAQLDDSLTGILIEPLSAIAGGIVGGVAVTALVWRLSWTHAERRATHTTRRQLRRLRRNLAGRP